MKNLPNLATLVKSHILPCGLRRIRGHSYGIMQLPSGPLILGALHTQPRGPSPGQKSISPMFVQFRWQCAKGLTSSSDRHRILSE